MPIPELHLSRPGVSFPTTRVDNAETLARVRRAYRGPDAKWPALEGAIERVFRLCNTQQRYLDGSPEANVADRAVAAARCCLDNNDAALDEIDLLVFGGISREYLEPATAMEVAAKLGLDDIHAFDVTTACVGHLEAIQAAAAYLTLHPHYRTALVCTSELMSPALSYDIQRTKDLKLKSAGLTIGDGATCVLLRRTPWPGGGLRLRALDTRVAPETWHLCQVPVGGTFRSATVEMMRLAELIPPMVERFLAGIGWKPADVDHFALHQPSEQMVRSILDGIGVDQAKGVYTHHLYGNNGSATIGIVLDHLLRDRDVAPGDKFVLGGVASGFVIVAIAGEWTQPGAPS